MLGTRQITKPQKTITLRNLFLDNTLLKDIKLESIFNSPAKIIYIFEKATGVLTESVVSISNPQPVTDVNGDYFCIVDFKRQLASPKKIIGIDAFHALILSVRFLEHLLSATYNEFEVRDFNGEKYVTPFVA